MAYFAENVAMFVMAMGGVLLLVGIGFLVLTLRLLRAGRDGDAGPGVRTATPVAGWRPRILIGYDGSDTAGDAIRAAGCCRARMP